MYGRSNPILRHFGADEIATLGTLQVLDDLREQGERVPSVEELNPRLMPDYADYFEFDRPVPSGVRASGSRDLLLEEATTGFPSADVVLGTASVPHDSGSPHDPHLERTTTFIRPRPGASSAHEVAYHRRGLVISASLRASRGGGRSSGGIDNAHSGSQGISYGGYASRGGSRGGSPPPATLTDRSHSSYRSPGSPGAVTPRRSYDDRPSIKQPPFRAGVPASGARESAATDTPRRTVTTSPGTSRSPSPRPRQPLSSDAGAPEPPQQQQHNIDVGASGSGAAVQVRGIGAKISGRRPTSAALTGRAAESGGTAAGRRPVSASPSTPRGGGTRGSAGAASGRVGSRPNAGAPAWAPAAGIENMRLDEMDEATRVAMALNDPGVGQQQASDENPSAESSPFERAQEQLAGQILQPPSQEQGSPLRQGSPGPQRSSRGGSPGFGQEARASLVSEQYFDQYRLRKHREVQGVPDYRFSQPRSHGAHVPVQQRYFSFDEAHPALAQEHYVRSPAQDAMLQAERRKMHHEMMRAARAAAKRRISMASAAAPTAQLAGDVERLTRVREAGRSRLRQLEQEGDQLRQQTYQVQQRAMDAIARSTQITSATRPSRSPSASPYSRRTHSRSPSPSYNGGFGASGTRYYSSSRSPSISPSRYRPASASPYRAERSGAAAYGYESGGSYGSPQQYQQRQQQQEEAEYYGGGAEAAAWAQRPMSAPPHMPVSPPPGPGEARQILEVINEVEGHSQGTSGSSRRRRVPSDDVSSQEEDPLVRASNVLSSRKHTGALDAEEQRIAMGVYDKSRYEEYHRQVDLEMQRRAMEGGYDSDLDRDEAAGLLVRNPQQEAEEEEEERRRAQEFSWQEDHSWMEEYRQRLGPEDGYLPSRAETAAGAGSGGSGGGSSEQYREEGSPLRPQRSALSEADEELLQQHYVPLISPELPMSAGGYVSEGPDGSRHSRPSRRRLFFKSTVPQPFQFEEREKSRPKRISKVKLEQDLALRRAEEEAAYNRRFRASPVPNAVAEPRYERMLLETEVKRQFTHQQRLEELASSLEKPFSFYYRDQETRAEREALARAAKDPNRFQKSFRARDVPSHAKEERFHTMMTELEARRDYSRRRVEEARRAARERVEQEAERRRETANRAYQERLRAVDPAVHQGPHPSRPMGVVPDFNSMHRNFEVQMARERANIRKRVTVPQEFRLNGINPQEQVERARKAEERRHRIILDMQVDAELLPENRWPYKSPRGKVRRTPPPAYLVEWMARTQGTHAASARRSSTAAAAQGGAYQTRAEREAAERKASEKLRAEALRRADRLLKAAQERKQKEAAAAAGGGDSEFGLQSDVGATAGAGGADQSSASGRGGAIRRRAAVAGRQDNPEVYVEARYAQIERRVRTVVEDALLDQGIEVYRYVEGVNVSKKATSTSTRTAG